VAQDWAQAARWYEKAAAAGYALAQTRLSELRAEMAADMAATRAPNI
jgi:TPR repeat protein